MDRRREAFCREYVRNGGDASAAYDHAYPPKTTRTNGTTRVEACKLMKAPDIQARITQLKAVALEKLVGEGDERVKDTVETLNGQLREAFMLARDKAIPKDMVAATMGQAKLLGFLVDKHDVNVTIRADDARSFIEKMATKYLPPAGDDA